MNCPVCTSATGLKTKEDILEHMTFDHLYARICNALRGDKPRVVAQYLAPGGRIQILFEDGTAKDIDV